MKLLTCTLALLLFCATSLASAEQSTGSNAVQKIESFLGRPVDQVTQLNGLDMLEITVGKRVLYADLTGSHIFIGGLFDATTRTNLTERTMQRLNKIDFQMLPFEDAITIVRGEGRRKIAIFSDVNCKFCKQTDKLLAEFDNSTIYIFMHPGSSELSQSISRDIWCSPARADAWTSYMQKNLAPPPADSKCISPTERVKLKAAELNVAGTPTIFFSSGTRFVGAIDRSKLDKLTNQTP